MIITLFTALAILITIIIFYNLTYGIALVMVVHILVPRVVRINLQVVDISIHTYLICILFFALIVKRILHKPVENITPNKSLRIIVVYLISILLFSFVRANVPLEEQISAQIQFFITDVLLGIIAFFAIENKNQIKIITIFIVISSVIGGIYGLYTYTLSANPYIEFLTLLYEQEDMVMGLKLLTETRGAIDGRIMGTYTHPLSWGQLLLLVLTFCITYLGIAKQKINYIYISFIVITIANIILTGSRSSIISVIVFFSFYFISFSFKNKVKYLYISCITILLCILLLPIASPKTKKIVDTAESIVFFWNQKKNSADIGGSTTDLREAQLIRSFELISPNPLFGLGRGYVKQADEDNIMLGYESIVYYKLVEEGLIGFLLFCLFYLALYKNTRNILARTEKKQIPLIDGFYLSYFVCIVLTGIQATFFMFLILNIFLLKQSAFPIKRAIKQKALITNI